MDEIHIKIGTRLVAESPSYGIVYGVCTGFPMQGDSFFFTSHRGSYLVARCTMKIMRGKLAGSTIRVAP